VLGSTRVPSSADIYGHQRTSRDQEPKPPPRPGPPPAPVAADSRAPTAKRIRVGPPPRTRPMLLGLKSSATARTLGITRDGPAAPDGPSWNPDLPIAIDVHPVEPDWDKPTVGTGEDRGVGQPSYCSLLEPRPAPRPPGRWVRHQGRRGARQRTVARKTTSTRVEARFPRHASE
jgi:hypothetical protein